MGDISRGIAIGMDAGGTKTVGILVDREGHELARSHAGGANPWDVGAEAARIALSSALQPLLAGGNVRAVCVGSAGIDRESDRAATEATLRSLLPADMAIDVRNDAAAALGLIGPKRPAMVVIAGTGSIAYGERSDGSSLRAGGHGAVIGDPGSGAALGLAALRHAANVLDRIENRGRLAEAVIEFLKLRTATDIVAKVMHPDLDVPLVATLSPLVEKALADGDAAAKSIVETEGNGLAALARRIAMAVRSDQSSLPALLVGGIFNGFPDICERVKTALRQTGPVMINQFSECVLGAARIAADLARSLG